MVIFPSVSARSAPRLTEPSTTRRGTAAAVPILAGVVPTIAVLEDVTGAPIQRQSPANGFTAIATRVHHRGGSPIHCAPARRSVLTPGPHRLLNADQATTSGASRSKDSEKDPSRGRLTGRSTSPGARPSKGPESTERSDLRGPADEYPVRLVRPVETRRRPRLSHAVLSQGRQSTRSRVRGVRPSCWGTHGISSLAYRYVGLASGFLRAME
jgi:hypothetical protein